MNRTQENILKYANIMKDTKEIANLTKSSEMVVQSTILNGARKNLFSKERAKQLLKDTKMVKWVDLPIKSGLSKPLPNKNERVKTIKA